MDITLDTNKGFAGLVTGHETNRLWLNCQHCLGCLERAGRGTAAAVAQQEVTRMWLSPPSGRREGTTCRNRGQLADGLVWVLTLHDPLGALEALH